jgi:bifunctional non-homologous end joining protein LigD
MGLKEYEAKRDFRKTPEPPGKPGKPHREPIFVVQEHHATQLHYDFRLEAEGVLKSWAVPKQPSMDPAQKRLAVHVEDHPIAYAEFKGAIPEGQYGAGMVAIWDKGSYQNLLAEKPVPKTVAEGIKTGRLEFALRGKKLQGRFALIRMGGKGRGNENWLLIKMRDELARPEGGAKGRPARKLTARPRAIVLPHRQPRIKPSKEAVTFTSLEKIMYPESGISKGDIIEFYRRIAPRLLPFLRDRPVTLERLPEGLGNARAPRFWQKNIPDSPRSGWIITPKGKRSGTRGLTEA